MSFQVFDSPPLEVGAGTLTNAGDQTVYYRDKQPVSSAGLEHDGVLNPGESVVVTGATWVVAGAGLRSAVTFSSSPPETGGSVDTTTVVSFLRWDGSDWTYAGNVVAERPDGIEGMAIWEGGGVDADPTPEGLGLTLPGDLWIPSEAVA